MSDLGNHWDVVGAIGLAIAIAGLAGGFLRLVHYLISALDYIPVWLSITIAGVAIMLIGMYLGEGP